MALRLRPFLGVTRVLPCALQAPLKGFVPPPVPAASAASASASLASTLSELAELTRQTALLDHAGRAALLDGEPIGKVDRTCYGFASWLGILDALQAKAFTVEPRVIIDNQSSNRFTVIDRVRTPEPTSLAMAPNLDFLAVTNEGADQVTFIDTDPSSATFHEVVRTVPVGVGPTGIAWESGNEDIFVCNQADGSVTIISTRAGAIGTRWPSGAIRAAPCGPAATTTASQPISPAEVSTATARPPPTSRSTPRGTRSCRARR